MSAFTTLDWIVVAAYFSVLLTIIWWVIREKQESTKEYFLAGRNLGWFVIGASIFNSGYGYKSPPLMNFVDSCDNGYGASGYPVIGPVSQITNANNVGINQAGGIPLFSQDGRPILAGGAGGTQVTTTKGENVYAGCLLYTSPSPRDRGCSRMPSSA